MSLSSLLPNAKKQATKVASPEVDLSSPQHSQSILWGHASRETLSSDESTTQWIDGSVARKAFITPTSKISGKGKTPRSTYHERVELSYSKPVLTPGRRAKSTKKSSSAKKSGGQRRAISKSKTPTISKRTKSSTKKLKTKRTKKPRAKSPQKHNFNNLKHISKGAYTDSASNLRWASELRTHEVLPSPTRGNINKGNDRVLDADDVGEALDLDVEVVELTKKLDAVSGKQVSSEALSPQPSFKSTANKRFLGITDVQYIFCHHYMSDKSLCVPHLQPPPKRYENRLVQYYGRSMRFVS